MEACFSCVNRRSKNYLFCPLGSFASTKFFAVVHGGESCGNQSGSRDCLTTGGEGQGILVCRRFERWRGDRGGLSSAPQSLPGLDRFACRLAPESFTTKKSTVRLRNNQTTPSQPVGKKISPGRISFGTDIQPSHHHLQSKSHHQ